jgi:hypothetical protein
MHDREVNAEGACSAAYPTDEGTTSYRELMIEAVLPSPAVHGGAFIDS